jgi:hypothetical protein
VARQNCGGLEAQPLLLLSPALIKLLRYGLYDREGLVDLVTKILHLFCVSGGRTGLCAHAAFVESRVR